MWENMVERDRPQMAIWCIIQGYKHVLTICSIYCVRTQQRLHERASMLRYTYTDCLQVRWTEFCAVQGVGLGGWLTEIAGSNSIVLWTFVCCRC